jgi:hypothetical protein
MASSNGNIGMDTTVRGGSLIWFTASMEKLVW